MCVCLCVFMYMCVHICLRSCNCIITTVLVAKPKPESSGSGAYSLARRVETEAPFSPERGSFVPSPRDAVPAEARQGSSWCRVYGALRA